MNCVSRRNRAVLIRRRKARGLTLVEMLVALTVVLIFFAGALFAFVEIVRAKERTQARLDAIANARHALETMTVEFKRARLLPEETSSTGTMQEDFHVLTDFLATGDRVDNDQDGVADEEDFDGLDNDGDWAASGDRHAAITTGSQTYYERRFARSVADPGDAGVDEDTRFTSTTVRFETFPLPSSSSRRHVRFWLGEDLDGTPNTLMFEATQDDLDASDPTRFAIAPVAHNVLSFSVLCYDASETTSGTPWKTRWNSLERLATRNEVPAIPPSVYLAVTVYSGTQPLSTVTATQPLETITLHTVVDVESVLADPRYDANRQTMTASP